MQIQFAALLFACLFAGLFALTAGTTSHAATTLPTKMNFQGRITNSAGNILSNGTYNMKFRIWSAASAGTQLWSEDRLVSASQGVAVTNGQFSVQLGSVTSLPASIFASNSLYFEIELPTPASATGSSPVWTEGAMTPRNQLATSAYAYNSETLDGLDSAAFGQLDQNNVFTGNNTFNGTIQGGSSLTLGTSSAQGSLVLNDGNGQTGTLRMADIASNYTYTIPVTTANDTFCLQTLANCAAGVTTVGTLDGGAANAAGASIVGTTIYLQSASASYAGLVNTTTQSFAGNKTFTGTLTVSGGASFSGQLSMGVADTVGTLLVLDTKTDAGDPAGTNGAMYYNSSLGKLRCYQNGAWTDCIGAGSSGGQTRKITLIPEYAGGVISPDGTNNVGSLTSDFDSTNNHSYYSWTNSTGSLNDYDVVVRTAIPSEYASGFGTFKLWVYAGSSSTANNNIQVTVKDASGAACANNVSILPGSIATWVEQGVTLSGCTFTANSIVTISIKMSSLSNNAVRIGEMSYQYTN